MIGKSFLAQKLTKKKKTALSRMKHPVAQAQVYSENHAKQRKYFR